jgi:hypothetical protein
MTGRNYKFKNPVRFRLIPEKDISNEKIYTNKVEWSYLEEIENLEACYNEERYNSSILL